jgi:two-component system, OmpR family, phosphate regulon response regulator PhoB
MEKNEEKNKKPLVLVVEDDTFLADLHGDKLTKEGFEVVVVGNGREALNFLKNRRPDIILLDIVMPIMDGIETLREIKKNPALKDIKVVILTNLSQEGDRQKTEEMGAVGYVVKANVSFSEIVDTVKKHLSIGE